MELMKNFAISSFVYLFLTSNLFAQNKPFDTLYFECSINDSLISYMESSQTWNYKAPEKSLGHSFTQEAVLDTLSYADLEILSVRSAQWIAYFPKNHGFAIETLRKHNKVLAAGSGRVGWMYDNLVLVLKDDDLQQATLIKVSYGYFVDN